MVFSALTADFCPFIQKSTNDAAGRARLHYNAVKPFIVSAMPSVTVDRLQPGIFISLSHIGWIRHPFLLNEFRLSSEKQIRALQEMGLKEVEWHPERSTALPLPVATSHEAEEGEMDLGASALAGMLDEKKQRIDRVRRQRENLARREREYNEELAAVSDILKRVGADAPEAHSHAQSLAAHVVAGLMGAESVAIQLVNQKARESGLAFHSLNVMVLSMLLGKTIGLSAEEMRYLGVGTLLHDVGKTEIPVRILRAASRTPPEEEFYRAHVGYGIKAVAKAKGMAVPARNIIACHHEHWDGSGFPNRLQGDKIPRLARIAAIADRYDNLCNPFDIKDAKTPSEALGHMFKNEGQWFDPELLQLFIKTLGIYPPGTFVMLSNGTIGLVIETDPARLLHPLVMLYDPEVPRNEALMLDLKEADLSVEQAVNPATLPLEAVEYLAPRGRIDYCVEGAP